MVVSTPNLLAIEIIVHDIDAGLALFRDAMGLELVERFTSTDPAGEMAILAVGGDLALTLFAPSASGPGYVLPKREPRLSQLVFGVESGALTGAAADLAEAGIAVQHVDDARFFVPPATIAGLLGVQAAIVMTGVAEAAAPEPE